jgi:hypothetical protein
MHRKTHLRPSDLRGLSRLAIDATTGVTDLVEAMHHNIARAPDIFGTPAQGRARGITGFVYRSIRGVTRLVGSGIDALLARTGPMLEREGSSPAREAVVAALNGVLGDYLAATDNPLAIPMRLRRDGHPLDMDRESLAAAIPSAGRKLLVLVHGLCMNDLQWHRQGHGHGAALARDLGYTPVYLHYNSGRHISTNGREFADVLETLLREWPAAVQELVILAHSMGGLVSRSALHYGNAAGHDWPRRLTKLVFLGTPHHGAPLERGGNWIDVLLGVSPYTAPFARLGKIRSAGITDLRYGSLLDEEWHGRDRFHPIPHRGPAVPLPEGVECYAMAATTGKRPDDLAGRILGDGIVPVASALGRHQDPARALSIPESQRWLGCGMNHWDLLSRSETYEQIRRWLDLSGKSGDVAQAAEDRAET